MLTKIRAPRRGHLPVTGPVDAIDRYYSLGMGTVMRMRLQWVLDALPSDGKVDRVLEIGYGSGVFQYELAARARVSVGIDIHDKHAQVRDQLAHDGLTVVPVQGDGSQLPFGNEVFDAVVIVSALEFIPDPAAALRESARVLRRGGQLVAIIPRTLPWADKMYTALAGFDPESEFRGGRARVQAALSALPGLERANRPRWLPTALAPYELLTFKRP